MVLTDVGVHAFKRQQRLRHHPPLPAATPKIGLLDDRRANDVGWRTIGDQTAIMQHDDAVGETAHHLHFVFDQQNGLVALGFQAF